ncbi:hypothetical protein Cyrtocomes_00237 [Candidatus Cyrtobacter comes]|uniref:Uncharacterized protein n=1 Tax=Candidatus Cyrtobacter comes TaxID=675776 RepID=A0ABU5L6X2_9RICK|nr:hypothetical protein [Candidatus Cyrtobacter comes]MDZ5761877.1 hypothetical protein [Candidatus Cyrtobacter comes]
MPNPLDNPLTHYAIPTHKLLPPTNPPYRSQQSPQQSHTPILPDVILSFRDGSFILRLISKNGILVDYHIKPGELIEAIGLITKLFIEDPHIINSPVKIRILRQEPNLHLQDSTSELSITTETSMPGYIVFRITNSASVLAGGGQMSKCREQLINIIDGILDATYSLYEHIKEGPPLEAEDIIMTLSQAKSQIIQKTQELTASLLQELQNPVSGQSNNPGNSLHVEKKQHLDPKKALHRSLSTEQGGRMINDPTGCKLDDESTQPSQSEQTPSTVVGPGRQPTTAGFEGSTQPSQSEQTTSTLAAFDGQPATTGSEGSTQPTSELPAIPHLAGASVEGDDNGPSQLADSNGSHGLTVDDIYCDIASLHSQDMQHGTKDSDCCALL